MRAKSQDEPRTAISSLPLLITASGSYYFTGNFQIKILNQDAIVVDANNVTIDLMGFSLSGTGSGTGRGIYMEGHTNVEIRNGTIRNFGKEGIYEAQAGPQKILDTGYGHRVIGIRAISNSGTGIRLFGNHHLVRGCLVLENGDDGITAGSGCTVTNNISSRNHNNGISLTGFGGTSSNNVTYDNNWLGIGIRQGCSVINNTSYGNLNYGIHTYGDGNLIKNNTVSGNGSTNILVDGTDNSIEENLLTKSGYGIRFLSNGNFFANNRAFDNINNYHNTTEQRDGGGNASF